MRFLFLRKITILGTQENKLLIGPWIFFRHFLDRLPNQSTSTGH